MTHGEKNELILELKKTTITVVRTKSSSNPNQKKKKEKNLMSLMEKPFLSFTTNIFNSYFSEQIYSLVHQTKCLRIGN